MKVAVFLIPLASISVFSSLAIAQTSAEEGSLRIPLRVPPGAPLRLYLTKPVSKRIGTPVEAKLLEPLFAFDREVVPAGSMAQGQVSRVEPVHGFQRVKAIVSGDFTPLRKAQVEFATLILPGGRQLPAHTVAAVILNSIYKEPSKKNGKQRSQPQNQNGGILGTAKRTAKDRIAGAVNARSRGIAEMVRGPDKKEKFVDFLWSKLPYHPQYMRRGTRLDAPLRDGLQFGYETIRAADVAELGSQPRPDTIVRVRLLTPLDSASAKRGQTVEAVVTVPLFSTDHNLVLPEGSRLSGAVSLAKRARSFHRPGQLRFTFQRIDIPQEVAHLRAAGEAAKTQASLAAAEAGGEAPIQVDSEGGVQAKESKSRFIAPAISLMIASRAADTEEGRHHPEAATAGAEGNVSGRTLGGGLGLGLLGAAISQSSKYVGMSFGYYGLAWSVYSNVIGRGGEVQFQKNAMMDIRFGARKP